jgi:large subunit ribosomal protein L21
MFAVIQTGGKQYKITKGSVLDVEFLGNPSDKVDINNICMVSDNDKDIKVLPSDLLNAKVTVEVLDNFYTPKVIVFKKRRRKNYRRKFGHKQLMSKIKVLDIVS